MASFNSESLEEMKSQSSNKAPSQISSTFVRLRKADSAKEKKRPNLKIVTAADQQPQEPF